MAPAIDSDYTIYRLGSTREGFLRVYPDADTISLTVLLNTIRGKHGHRRISKNGTPEQRGSRSVTPNGPEPSN